MTGPATHPSSSRAGSSSQQMSSSGKRNTSTITAASGAGTISSSANAVNKSGTPLIDDPNVLVDPIEFETFPIESLRKYKASYKLSVPSSISNAGNLLNGPVGKKTYSYKHRTRISKDELAGNVERHFSALPVRETEMIAGFLYSAKNQNNAFRLHFPVN
ncbi:hypothetical protein POJ06DRAFT_265921 [Lipomyces tetrasporus]|uniref:Histone deacetylase complex subunit SAP30 Sin3 binding domain-containing protein n=1 Tax=Lipomyces tetrasporus TaxID=54092 RepID=A0AAD7QX16_9ASCO|nr:uncharacterized protein POJ06DRAFT_265921 [Lipomyces tetrasporus]KAJ8103062.1 hypothetical protein POJ06DRAFT_265921 [Lipomyces tetrasporus]